MPRTAINHQNTIIYKIICNDDNVKEIYVGSTTDFIRRKSEHKSGCNSVTNKSYNNKLYTFMRNNGGFDNFTMLEVEKYPCNDGNESKSRVRVKYDELKATLNSKRPKITYKELQEVKNNNALTYRKNQMKTRPDIYITKLQIMSSKINIRDYDKEPNKNYSLEECKTKLIELETKLLMLLELEQESIPKIITPLEKQRKYRKIKREKKPENYIKLRYKF